MTALMNGQPASEISLADRGLHYGDGLFETMRVHNGRICYLARHLARLEQGCSRLGIPFPGRSLLEQEVKSLVEGTDGCLVKLIVTRGSGGRGYAPPAASHPTRILMTYRLPQGLETRSLPAIRVRRCVTRLAVNPALAGIKHLNRLEQVLARSEWRDPAFDEGLVYDTGGYLVEATRSNVFLVTDGQVFTPELGGCGVAGVMRERVIELAEHRGLAVHAGRLTDTELNEADEVFLTSSVRGIQAVVGIDDAQLSQGPVTRSLHWALAEETGW